MTRKYSSISVETTLASGINTTQTTMTVPSSAAATSLLGGQTLAAGNVDIFTVVIDPDTSSEEVVFVTDVNGDTLTISRGQAGTGTAGVSGISHGAGATVRHVLTSSDLDFFRNGVATADAAIAKSIVNAKGDLIVATADDTPARLAVGSTNGQALTVDSSTASGLAWATISSAPKIGQVVTTGVVNTAGGTSTSSTSYVDVTNFSLSITPTSATSKIIVVADFGASLSGTSPTNIPVAYFQIQRGSTAIINDAFLGLYTGSPTVDFTLYPRQTIFLVDSPATTSSTTYKLRVRSNVTSGSVAAGQNGSLTLMEVVA